MNSNSSENNMLLSDLLFSWDNNNQTNNMDNNDLSSLLLLPNSNNSSNSINNSANLVMDDSSSLYIDPLMNTSNSFYNTVPTTAAATVTAAIPNPSFAYGGNDNAFYDLFPQEKQQFIINSSSSYINFTEPSSSQLLLHQQALYNNHHSLIVEPFTDNSSSSNSTQISVVQQSQKRKSSNSSKSKRKKSLVSEEEGDQFDREEILVLQGQSIEQQQEMKKPKKKKKRKTIPAADVDPNAPPKPKRITGLNKPLILSNSLQTIMEGATELSRPEIVKRLWNYIKSNQLQDPADRRFILCDGKLKSIFQKDRVNSFGMNRDLSAHLTKKEEPSASIALAIDDVSSTDNLITNNDIPPSSIIINTATNLNNSLMIEDFSPVPTAETPDIMTPSDSEILLQKWSSGSF